MPAVAFNTTAAALSAVLIQSLVPVDSDVGIRYGMTSLLMNNPIQVKPARERNVKTNHRKAKVMSLSVNPTITLSIDSDITKLDGPFSTLHPGSAIDIALIQNYYAAMSHGFPTDAANWFELMTPDFTMPPGDLCTTKFDLELWTPSMLTGGTYVYGNIT